MALARIVDERCLTTIYNEIMRKHDKCNTAIKQNSMASAVRPPA